MEKTLRTRDEAERLGMTHFYTGRACIRGHDALRYVSTGNCTACHNDRAKTRRTARNFRLQGFSTFTVRVPPELREAFLALVGGLGLEAQGPDVATAPPAAYSGPIVPPGPQLPPPPSPSPAWVPPPGFEYLTNPQGLP